MLLLWVLLIDAVTAVGYAFISWQHSSIQHSTFTGTFTPEAHELALRIPRCTLRHPHALFCTHSTLSTLAAGLFSISVLRFMD
jgi:hypothetical protein